MPDFVCVTGLPRSGTTLLGAMLDAHPDVDIYFEPWGGEHNFEFIRSDSVAGFVEQMGRKFPNAQHGNAAIVGLKQPIIKTPAAEACRETLAVMDRPSVLLILRDPVECFLSRVETAHKHWGVARKDPLPQNFRTFLTLAARALDDIRVLLDLYGGQVVSYDALVMEPHRTMRGVSAGLGIAFDQAMLDYYRGGPRPNKVRGDPGVVSAPQPVCLETLMKRREQAKRYRKEFPEIVEAYHQLFDFVSGFC